MHVTGQLTPDEFWAHADEVDDQVRRTFPERPAYAVQGWPGRALLSEWSLGSGIRSLMFLPTGWDGASSVDDVRPRVDVLVDATEPRQVVAHRFASEEFARTGKPEALARRDEMRHPDAIIDLWVDGVAEPFELWSVDARSCAAGRVGAVTVLIETTRHPVTDVALERVRDIEPLIAERRRWIRDVRGGE